MSDYTTKTASLKATTIDTRKIDAKQIDTKTLNINGISMDEKLKQAAIASRGNLLIFSLTNGINATIEEWLNLNTKDLSITLGEEVTVTLSSNSTFINFLLDK